MFVRISQVAQMVGVSPSTLRRWDKDKNLSACFRTIGGHRRYSLKKLLTFSKQIPEITKPSTQKKAPPTRVVTYARVSSSKQRTDLTRQVAHLNAFIEHHDWQLVKSYQDIGSGLNDRRPGLLRLIKDLPMIQPSVVLCSYQDRLTRFGGRLLKTICDLFGTKIVVTHQRTTDKPLNDQLVEDVLAVMTSFAGKLHRARRGQQTT